MRKAIRFADTLINRVVAVICLLLFLICLYAMIDAVNVYLNANDTSVLKFKPKLGESQEPLGEVVKDAVAWLTVDGTSIDHPVMQGKTNDTYINKDPYGNFSLSGSIFLDSRNSSDFSDEYSMIYGHHMEHGAMFGALDDFSDPAYFDLHRSGTLITSDGTGYSIAFFACCKAPANETVVFDPPESNNSSLLKYIEANAAIYYPDEVDTDSVILALSTCQSAETIERLVVFGVLTQITAEESNERSTK